MTKKKMKAIVIKRMQELRASRENLVGNITAHNGAIEQCEWFLQELEKEEKADETTSDSGAINVSDFIRAVEKPGSGG